MRRYEVMPVWESTLIGLDATVQATAKTVWASAQPFVERAFRKGVPRAQMRTAKSAQDRVRTSWVRCASSSGRGVERQVDWFQFEGDLLGGHDHAETARLVGEVMAWHRAKSIVLWARQGSELLCTYEPALRISLASLPAALGKCGLWLVEP